MRASLMRRQHLSGERRSWGRELCGLWKKSVPVKGTDSARALWGKRAPKIPKEDWNSQWKGKIIAKIRKVKETKSWKVLNFGRASSLLWVKRGDHWGLTDVTDIWKAPLWAQGWGQGQKQGARSLSQGPKQERTVDQTRVVTVKVARGVWTWAHNVSLVWNVFLPQPARWQTHPTFKTSLISWKHSPICYPWLNSEFPLFAVPLNSNNTTGISLLQHISVSVNIIDVIVYLLTRLWLPWGHAVLDFFVCSGCSFRKCSIKAGDWINDINIKK